MNFFITGTRRGLGKALYSLYDTVNYLEDCDVFINCKHDGYKQVELLYKAAELNKRIINIGSNDETPVIKPGSGVKTEQDILAPTPRAIASQETVDLDVESVKAQYAEEASLSATLIQSITTLHNRSEKAELKEVVSEEAEVKNFINKLGESARVVHSESGNDKNRMQLEVRKENEWVQVMAYELSPSKSVRIEYSIKGKKPKQIKMDLPASAMQEMARNDLSNNWEEYCKKFLAGKKITA